MNHELDEFDFEKGYLAAVLKLTGDHLAAIERCIDPNDPDGNTSFFDPMEHIAGVAVVAAQRYICSVCKWLSIPKEKALLLGPKKKNAALAEVVDAAANYWKHIEDGEKAVFPCTRDVLAKASVVFESGYCVLNCIRACGYEHLSELLDDLVGWRDAVILEAQNSVAHLDRGSQNPQTRRLNRARSRLRSTAMSTVQEIETALRRLTPAEMRAVRDWIDEILEDQLELTPEFAAKIARSEQEMEQGNQPRTRQP